MIKLKMHHVGCLVENIEEAFNNYKILISDISISKIYFIEEQKVKVAFLNISDQLFLELVEVTDETTSLYKMKKKGVSFYHLAFLDSDFDNRVIYLQNNNYRLISIFNSEAFDGNKCAFFYTPDMQLIELIEA